MMVHRFRMMHRGQRGITLVELLVVVAIVGLISAGISILISQTITGSARDSDRMILVRQVQQAGTEVQTDVIQAQWLISESGHKDGFPLKLWWEWEGRENDVRYWLDGTDLLRTHNGQTRRVARYITSAVITPPPYPSRHQGGMLTFTVTASFDGQEDETRIYTVEPRPNQIDRPDED